MKRVTLPGGATTPALGLGSWRLGESQAARKTEVAALRTAIAQGYRLFDTAEMDGEGGAEACLARRCTPRSTTPRSRRSMRPSRRRGARARSR